MILKDMARDGANGKKLYRRGNVSFGRPAIRDIRPIIRRIDLSKRMCLLKYNFSVRRGTMKDSWQMHRKHVLPLHILNERSCVTAAVANHHSTQGGEVP